MLPTMMQVEANDTAGRYHGTTRAAPDSPAPASVAAGADWTAVLISCPA